MRVSRPEPHEIPNIYSARACPKRFGAGDDGLSGGAKGYIDGRRISLRKLLSKDASSDLADMKASEKTTRRVFKKTK
jgi:hypothetical protein